MWWWLIIFPTWTEPLILSGQSLKFSSFQLIAGQTRHVSCAGWCLFRWPYATHQVLKPPSPKAQFRIAEGTWRDFNRVKNVVLLCVFRVEDCDVCGWAKSVAGWEEAEKWTGGSRINRRHAEEWKCQCDWETFGTAEKSSRRRSEVESGTNCNFELDITGIYI